MKSIIFLTTPTSATASMWRILHILYGKKYNMLSYTNKFYIEGRLSDLQSSEPPEEDTVVYFNTPQHFNRALNRSRYNFIVNVRDPRDLLCNQFHWVMQHPIPGYTEEQLQNYRHKNISMGIDGFATKKDVMPYYDGVHAALEGTNPDAVSFCTYSALCLDFPGFIKRASHFMTEDITDEQWIMLQKESPEKIQDHNLWIGNKWKGADIMPGRYKNELKPETIQFLNELHEKNLLLLRENDLPSVCHTYDF